MKRKISRRKLRGKGAFQVDELNDFWDYTISFLIFPASQSMACILFWLITISLIFIFVFRKQSVRAGKLRWIFLFAAEAVALFYANLRSRWCDPPTYGMFPPLIKGYKAYRVGVVILSLQAVATLVMLIYFCIRRKKQPNKQPAPPKPPERTFCGDR